ncbi:hypothetical protein [Mycobacterium sp. SMC-13]|uniref:hypothetical protein n=1 Tax=Mycobacterium sp. SMC-13 TaxID=3381626 RepID=UPI003875F48E
MTAVRWVVAVALGFVVAGLVLVVTGVGLLWGSGWALIVGGVLLVASAVGGAVALLWGSEK